MSVYATKEFWTGVMERSVKVGGAAAAATIGSGALNLQQVDWVNVASVTGLALVVNLLVCFSQPKFVAGVGESSGGELLQEQIEEMTTITKYRPAGSPPDRSQDSLSPPQDRLL